MSSPNQLLEPDYLARIKALQLKARTIVDGALTGLHRSPHHGSSVEFAEHNEYAPGDDIRRIDWRVYAKSDKYYVKRFEQETDLQALIMIDSSSSMLYKSDDVARSKWDYACVLAASMAYLLLRQQDSVGLLIADNEVRTYVPPRSRSTHLMQLCSELLKHGPEPGSETQLVTGMNYLSEVIARRGLLIVLSDFLDTDERYFQVLKQLKSRRHNVHMIHVMDPWELNFPFSDVTIFKSLESGAQILAEPLAMKETYLKEVRAFVNGVRRSCFESGIEYRLMDTSVDLSDAFSNLVAGSKQADI